MAKRESKNLATRPASRTVDEAYRSIAEILTTARATAYRAVCSKGATPSSRQ